MGRMAILWTGSEHDTPGFADNKRDYDKIEASSKIAREGVLNEDIEKLAEGVALYYEAQLDEGMSKLPEINGAIALNTAVVVTVATPFICSIHKRQEMPQWESTMPCALLSRIAHDANRSKDGGPYRLAGSGY